MKYLHDVKITVFAKQGEDSNAIEGGLKLLVPFELEKEKLCMTKTIATGLAGKKIEIIELSLKKERHTKLFLDFLQSTLREDQKSLLFRQANSRIDDELNFYIRFDKEKWLSEKSLWITDEGNCYHVKMHLAAFPVKKEKGVELIKIIFAPTTGVHAEDAPKVAEESEEHKDCDDDCF